MVEWQKYIKVNLSKGSLPQDLKPYIRRYFSTPVVIFRVTISIFYEMFSRDEYRLDFLDFGKWSKQELLCFSSSNQYAFSTNNHLFREIFPNASLQTSITRPPEDLTEEYFEFFRFKEVFKYFLRHTKCLLAKRKTSGLQKQIGGLQLAMKTARTILKETVQKGYKIFFSSVERVTLHSWGDFLEDALNIMNPFDINCS